LAINKKNKKVSKIVKSVCRFALELKFSSYIFLQNVISKFVVISYC